MRRESERVRPPDEIRGSHALRSVARDERLTGQASDTPERLELLILAFGIEGLGLRYLREVDWMQPMFEGLVLIVAVASRQAVVRVNRRRPTGTADETSRAIEHEVQPSPASTVTDERSIPYLTN